MANNCDTFTPLKHQVRRAKERPALIRVTDLQAIGAQHEVTRTANHAQAQVNRAYVCLGCGQAGIGQQAFKPAKLQVLSGAFAGRELELSKALTTLGRPGVQVAAITRRADGYFIVHVDSDSEGNFPLVNGSAIGAQARKLQDNDVIQLAGVKMGFFEG